MEVGSLWTDIQWINQQLQAFVEDQDYYYYVDTGHVFLNRNRTRVNSRLIGDGLHPRTSGMAVWGPIIAQAVQWILKDEL